MVEESEESCTSETLVKLLVECETPCTSVDISLFSDPLVYVKYL